MRRRRISLFLTFTLLFSSMVSPGVLAQSGAGRAAAKDRTVIVISLDGFPGWMLDDPKLPVPTLRKLWREGAAAKRMTVSNPAVTWPNHTTMVTGVSSAKHGVLYNGLLLRDGPRLPVKIEQWRDKSELVRVPTVYDLAYKAGLTTAQVDWIPTQNSGTISWEFPERPNPQGAVEREMVEAGIISAQDLIDFNKSSVSQSWRDQYYTQAAVHMITKHKPNLLLFHLLDLDSTHHNYGPKSRAGYTSLAFMDACVRQIMDALQSAGVLERATLLVVSDHGFKVTKRNIRPNAALRQQGLLKFEGGRVTACDAYAMPAGGTAMIYATNPENKDQVIPRLKEFFRSVEGVARVLEPADYPALGLPTPQENNQVGDLILVAKDGYGFGASAEGEAVVDVGQGSYPGHHGYLSGDQDMDALFLAWGYGIRPGVRLDRVSNTDVAPTIAALLGLQMTNVEGKKLDQILAAAPATSSK